MLNRTEKSRLTLIFAGNAVVLSVVPCAAILFEIIAQVWSHVQGTIAQPVKVALVPVMATKTEKAKLREQLRLFGVTD